VKAGPALRQRGHRAAAAKEVILNALKRAVRPEENIVLIGMAYAGKSTVGPLLARVLLLQFVDTDLLIQAGEGATLQRLIEERGMVEFKRLEEHYVMSLDCQGFVIATGGSVIYSGESMGHLKSVGSLVYLDVPLRELEARMHGAGTRGLVIKRGMSFADLYRERKPLYEENADIIVDCGAMHPVDIVQKVATGLALRE
jgi:shikimate kinase